MARNIDELSEFEVRVHQDYAASTPRKARRVIDTLRGKYLGDALNQLRFQSQAIAVDLYKLGQNALNAARQRASYLQYPLNENKILITEIYADQGNRLKRYRPAPKGSAHSIHKFTTHLYLVVDITGGEEVEI